MCMDGGTVSKISPKEEWPAETERKVKEEKRSNK